MNLESTSPGSFELSDLIETNCTVQNLQKIQDGVYRFEVVPDDNSSSKNISVSIAGSQVSTAVFGESLVTRIFLFCMIRKHRL